MNGSNSIADLREKIAPVLKQYHVQKAIVFGSFARGDVSRHSDVDLILVQQTARRFWDRYDGLLDALNRALPERALDVLIYTPDELVRMSYRAFIQSALCEGKVIDESE